MITNKRTRHSIAVLLAISGGVVMFLAPQAWIGAVFLGLGVVLEVIGIALEHDSRPG